MCGPWEKKGEVSVFFFSKGFGDTVDGDFQYTTTVWMVVKTFGNNG